jgi:hypothetical protein
MAGQILVALKRDDRVEEIIPYLEKLTKPGMRIVFLVRYPVDGFEWMQAHVTMMETGMQTTCIAAEAAARYSMERQRRLAMERLLPISKRLRGVEITVDIHAGPLRKVLRRYSLHENVHLIMMRAGREPLPLRLLNLAISRFGLFTRPSLSPMLLLHPGALL